MYRWYTDTITVGSRRKNVNKYSAIRYEMRKAIFSMRSLGSNQHETTNKKEKKKEKKRKGDQKYFSGTAMRNRKQSHTNTYSHVRNRLH